MARALQSKVRARLLRSFFLALLSALCLSSHGTAQELDDAPLRVGSLQIRGPGCQAPWTRSRFAAALTLELRVIGEGTSASIVVEGRCDDELEIGVGTTRVRVQLADIEPLSRERAVAMRIASVLEHPPAGESDEPSAEGEGGQTMPEEASSTENEFTATPTPFEGASGLGVARPSRRIEPEEEREEPATSFDAPEDIQSEAEPPSTPRTPFYGDTNTASARFRIAGGQRFLGAELEYRRRIQRELSFFVGASMLTDTANFDEGNVRFWSGDVSVGVSVSRHAARMAFGLRLAVRAGIAAYRAVASLGFSATNDRGFIAAIVPAGVVRVHVHGPLHVEAIGELSFTLRGFEAAIGDVRYGWGGVLGGGRVGLALDWD